MRVEAGLGCPNQPPAGLLAAHLSLANLPKIVGQVGNLRPGPEGAPNRPTAGPAKLLRRSSQACPHRIHLNIIRNPLKFRFITNQPIIARVLRERRPGQSKHPIALTGRKSLKRLHHFANLHPGRHQEMNMICHHNVRVEMVMPRLTVVNGLHHHSGDLRNANVERPGACVIENAVHSDEHLSGGCRSRKAAVSWKAAMQTPCDEDRLADGMVVGEPAASKRSHLVTVADWGKILRKVERPIGGALWARPQVTNLPHKAGSRQHALQPAATANSKAMQQPTSHQPWSSQPNAA